MSDFWESIGLMSLGILTIVWIVIKFVSCIFVAGYISLILGLNGLIWWFSSIILFTILLRLVFTGNTGESYKKLVDAHISKDETDNELLFDDDLDEIKFYED